MSLNAFISGQSVVTAFGDHVPNTNPLECRRADENRLGRSISEDEDEDADTSIKLAERTSSLMSSYRDFVSEKEYDEEMMLGRAGTGFSSSSTASFVERMNNVGSEFSSLSSRASPRRAQPLLLNDWSHNSSSTASNIGIMSKNSMSNDDQKYHYTHPSYNYKKLKRFAAMGAILVILMMIAIMVSSGNQGNGSNNSEISSAALAEERKKTELMSLLLEQDEKEQEKGEENFGDENEGHNLDTAASYQQFKPQWFDRATGWNGSSYREAMEFCSAIKSFITERPMTLCPYEAMCPMGPNKPPAALSSTLDNLQRSPILKRETWIHLGGEEVCTQDVKMMDTFEYHEGGEELVDVTGHVCCVGIRSVDVTATLPASQQGGGEVENVPVSANAIQEVDNNNDEKNDASAIIGEEEEEAENVPAQEVDEDSHTFVPVVKPGPEYYIENEEQEEESSSSNVESTVDSTVLQLHEEFKPLWLSSAEGWKGGSYADAVAFCNSTRGKQLCPYSVICPNGPGHAVMGGRHALEFKVEGEQYAPILGGDNHWVMVGNTNNTDDGGTEDKDSSTKKCMTHRQLEGKNPEWGLNGDRSEVKQHIMCCTVNTAR
jgi:hypothetical protein